MTEAPYPAAASVEKGDTGFGSHFPVQPDFKIPWEVCFHAMASL